jgi:hypothetical protein
VSTVGFIRFSLNQMHNTYNDATRDLSPEQMSWPANWAEEPQPGPAR